MGTTERRQVTFSIPVDSSACFEASWFCELLVMPQPAFDVCG